MSARFLTNFIVLLLGSVLAAIVFAMSRSVADWVALGAGASAGVLALVNFATADQGAYQRIADVLILLVGAWAIVAARVMSYPGQWLVFGAAAALAGLGALGLVVREIRLAHGLDVGQSHIGPDQFAYMAALQREGEGGR